MIVIYAPHRSELVDLNKMFKCLKFFYLYIRPLVTTIYHSATTDITIIISKTFTISYHHMPPTERGTAIDQCTVLHITVQISSRNNPPFWILKRWRSDPRFTAKRNKTG